MALTVRMLCLFAVLLLAGCVKDDNRPVADPYAFTAPEHFPPVAYDFERNPVTEAGFQLGKRLFEDTRLSRDGSVSCSNCHQQVTAFADPQHRFSVGVEGRSGVRNAPGLFNLAFRSDYMWDGGVTHLDFVALPAIDLDFELDNSLAEIIRRLDASPSYHEDFRAAFGQDTITSGLMLQALSQYQAMLVSDRSKYDDVLTNRNEAAFTEAEIRGESLFTRHCAGCHAGVLQTDNSFRNNGLDGDAVLGEGRMAITGIARDRGRFRVPSLRNVARTPPYMHDGRFQSLEEVLDHYTSGIQASPTLDPRIDRALVLTPAERTQLIDFLRTLTDWEFLADKRF